MGDGRGDLARARPQHRAGLPGGRGHHAHPPGRRFNHEVEPGSRLTFGSVSGWFEEPVLGHLIYKRYFSTILKILFVVL